MTTQQPPRLKPGQDLRGLHPDVLTSIVAHPLQMSAVGRIEKFLGWMDACVSPGDLYDFQQQLFGAVFEIETRRGACTRAVKRLRQGRSLQANAPDLTEGSDRTDIATWEFEVLICERLARQLRCVGDGLAWKAYRYDRRFIIALAHNQPPGLLIDKDGLGYEIGRVQDLWRDEKHFGLLHDLTTCLRIADVTEFTSDNGALLHEVKKRRRVPAAQKARAQSAIDAIMSGGVLPGAVSDARLVVLSTRYCADMNQLRDAITLAQSRGLQGISLREGRMLFAASLRSLAGHASGTPDEITNLFVGAKRAALHRAKIDGATHHLVGNSGDTTARSPFVAPLSIFPLEAADRAELICDLLTLETTVSVDALAKMLSDRGLQVQVLFPNRSQQVPHDADVLQVRLGGRGMTIHAPAMNPLMFELLRPSAWCDAVAESLALAEPPAHPEVVLRDEASTWR